MNIPEEVDVKELRKGLLWFAEWYEDPFQDPQEKTPVFILSTIDGYVTYSNYSGDEQETYENFDDAVIKGLGLIVDTKTGKIV